MEEAPTKEVVKALLDYLVDPLLPSKVSKKDPSLDTQEAVAKQMHAVVLLYNYYHRLQNPKLEFMEFGEFCKLAVSLKPTLIAHMKYMQRADLTGSDDMETHISMTEKAIKNACKIALALTSLKDVSHVEKWPVSKVSALLINPKKDKCLLSFDTITNGVWSVIEKCLNSADLSHESPSKGKHTNKRKWKAGNELTCEPIDGKFAYQRIALSAVMEATGLKQSEITVLEKHVTYSLSEEKMAAYFYIMQSTESSNEDNQLPIKTVLESLQGPLLKWTSNDWILTQKIEYYDVLPYAQIMSNWLSRERGSDCSQTLKLSIFGGGEKDSETEAVEIVKVNSTCLHNLIVELENTNTNSSQGPEKPNDGEVRDNMGSICGNWTGTDSWSKESSGADTSNRKEKVDEKEKSDKESPEKPSDLAPNGADSNNRKEVGDEEKHDNCTTEKPSNKEIKDNRGSVFGNYTGANSCGKESTGADSSNGVEKVDEKEKPNKKFPEKPSDGEPTGADTSNRKEVGDEEKHDNCTTEKPSNEEIKDNRGSVFGNYTGANSCGKESTGAESSDGMEKVDEKEKPDKKSPEKPSDGVPTGADTSNRKEVGDEEKHDNCTTEKPSNEEIKDNRGSVFGNYTGANSSGKESTGAESSDGVEKVDEKEKPDKKSPEKPSDGEPTGADTSNRKEVGDEEKHDNCTTEKPSNKEIKDNRGSVFGNYTGANSCGEESTRAESPDGVEKVDEKEKPDKKSPEKPSDGVPTGADTSNRKEVGDEEKHDNCTTEKPGNKEIKDNRGSVFGNYTGANSCGKESTGAESSDGVEKVDEKEKPDKKSPEKPSDGEPTGADTSNRKEIDVKEKSDKCTLQKPSPREIQENKVRIYGNCSSTNACGKESIGVEKFYMEEDVDENPDKQSPEFSSDGELTGVDSYNRNEEADSREKPDNNAPEKPSDRDVQENMHRDCMDVQSCGKESIGEESSNKEEVDTREKPDKYAPEMPIDVEPTTAVRFHRSSKDVDDGEKPDESTPEKPSNAESKDIAGNIYESCMGPNSCSEEPTGADSFNRKEHFDDQEKHVECYDISNSNSTSFSTADTGDLKMISAEEPQTLLNFSSKRQKTSVYGISNRNASMPIRVYHHQKRKISVESCPGSSAALTPCNEASEAMKKSSRNEFIDRKVAGICTQGYLSSHPNDIPAENSALVPYDPNANDAGKMQTLLATKETEISEIALKVLLQKREEMCYQQRILEDKIASCSRDIQKIIDGDEDALALKLEVMIDCCNDTCLKGMINQSDVQRTGQCSRRNRQSDSILTFQSSCQELDNMCHTNNWRLPVYLISALTGGFIAKIAMKERDFDLLFEGELKSTPEAARDSAAALMVAKLRKT